MSRAPLTALAEQVRKFETAWLRPRIGWRLALAAWCGCTVWGISMTLAIAIGIWQVVPVTLGFILNILGGVACVVFAARLVSRRLIQMAIDRSLAGPRCLLCDCDLLGNTTGACPECGQEMDPHAIRAIPCLLGWSGHPGRNCRVCEYDLTGNVTGVCPECGASVRPADG